MQWVNNNTNPQKNKFYKNPVSTTLFWDSEMKHHPYWGVTNIMRHHTKCNHLGFVPTCIIPTTSMGIQTTFRLLHTMSLLAES
jgi:hypothetical protein